MSRPLPWFWIGLALLLLLPGPAGRLLLDLLGGLTLTLLLLPLLLGGAGWIAWQVLRSRLRACPACGTNSFATDVCPACGSSMEGAGPPWATAMAERLQALQEREEVDVREVTINVEAVEVPDADSGNPSATPPA
ncbi:MAG: hypothetical protein ACKOXO_10995 [Cyanobium sp.]